MIELINNHYAIEVPEGLLSPKFEIEQNISALILDEEEYELIIWHTERRCGSPTGRIVIDLPPGTWQIACTSKEATEDQLSDLVGPKIKGGFAGQMEGYKDYYVSGCDLMPLPTRRISFESLLKAKECDLNKNWLIIKKG